MAVDDGLPMPHHAMPGDVPSPAHQARAARRRRSVIRYVVLMSAARVATDKRTLVAVIVVAVGLAAAAELASEGGNPLAWYMSLAGGKRGGTP